MTSSPSFYTPAQRDLQDQFKTRALADRLELAIMGPEITQDHAEFISSRDFFFLATVTADGEPTVSYKGGDVGLVTVVDATTLAFPIYDGNGMFLSAGNMADTGKVAMLFIDHVTPHRLRVQGNATIEHQDPLLDAYPGAVVICRVETTNTFVNCGRYIHKHTRVSASPHVPDAQGNAPLATWKRIDAMQDVLPEHDAARVEAEGGTITGDEYADRLSRGES